MNESYEELVKQLKPCSVKADRMSDEEYAKHKLIDDPNLIRDETPIVSERAEQHNDEVDIEVIIIDIPNTDTKDSEVWSDSSKYTCFFCKSDSLIGYDKAFSHFQLHIDYFPIQCAICDEANTDTKSFINHCRVTHPLVNKASYYHKLNKPSEKWIEDYLKSQSSHTKNTPHAYCPACDWIHLNPDVNAQSGEQSKKNSQEILQHIHEHIHYVPFNCLKCRDEGREEFCLSVLDHQRIRKHLMATHCESYEPPGWKYFGKKYAIHSLDKFISNYLSIFGIKIIKKKTRVRKPKESDKIVSSILSNANHNQTGVNQLPVIMPTTNITQTVLLPQHSTIINGYKPVIQPQNQQLFLTLLGSHVEPNVKLPQSGMFGTAIQLQASVANRIQSLTSPLLLLPSNKKLNLQPQAVESTDLGIICVDPKLQVLDDKNFKYICVFCTEKYVTFTTKLEACIHYSQHVDYYPIKCLLCESKFNELNELTKHYDETHHNYKNNIFHYIKEDIDIETWIDEFLDFQKTYDFKANVSATYGDYCVVCKKLSPKTVENGFNMKLKLTKENTSLIRAHIYQHLSYFPYQCTVCFHGDRRVRFASLNLSASNHLKDWHQTKSFSHSEFEKLFAKCCEIVRLEKYIDNDIFGVRENNALNEVKVTVKRKLEEIEEKTKEMKAKKPIRLTSILNDSRISPQKTYSKIIGNVNNSANLNLRSLLASNGETIVLKTTPVNGIISPVKPINNYSSVLLKKLATTATTADSTNNGTSYCQRFLQCFHCHEVVNNTVEMESHHQLKHPKLSLASYTPNRDDISKFLNNKFKSNVITIID